MTGNQAQGIELRDRGKDQLGLHHRKIVADTLARSSPERKIGEARTTSRALWREAFRVEHLRLLPECRVTVSTILAHKDHAFRQNTIAANLILGYGMTREAEGGRIEPHRFLDHHARVGQCVELFNSRQSP